MSFITPGPQQQLIARAYCNGAFAHFAGPYDEFDLINCGDSLFIFLMVELSIEQGAEGVVEVLARIEAIRRQIDKVDSAFIQTL